MSTSPENTCLRCRADCTAAASIVADVNAEDGSPASFICVGWNHPESRTVPQDRFTLCWKNAVVDERGHWDKRDLLDTMSVIAQALSTDENVRVNENLDENVRVNENLDEDGMQQVNMIG